jgi:hypothetical protein
MNGNFAKLMVWVAASVAGSCIGLTPCLAIASGKASPERTETPSYEELKKTELKYPLNQLHQMSEDDFRAVACKVKHDLDPRCLSNKDCRVVFSVFYSESGIPACKKIASQNDTAADDFYCEQAIWENVMPSFAPGRR